MAYCTLTDVANYCTVAEGADVTGAIAAATLTVDAYTSNIHEPRTITLNPLLLSRIGSADLPYSTRAITAVADSDSGSLLPMTGWTLLQGTTPQLRITTAGLTSILVLGREPWNSYTSLSRVTVTGDFGPEETPAPVKDATAILAAAILVGSGRATWTPLLNPQDISDNSGIASVSVEGYSVSYRDTAVDNRNTAETTGTPIADRMLAPYRRTKRARWA